MTDPHFCFQSKCTGERYSKLHVFCRFCKCPVYLECLRNKSEKVTKDLMIVFGLATIQGDQFKINANRDKVADFQNIFDIESPFSISCDLCASKVSDIEGVCEKFKLEKETEMNALKLQLNEAQLNNIEIKRYA